MPEVAAVKSTILETVTDTVVREAASEADPKDDNKLEDAMNKGTVIESSPKEEGITTPKADDVKNTTPEVGTEVSTTRKTTAVEAVAGRAVMTGGGSELETVAAVKDDTDEENKFGDVEPSGNGTGGIVSSILGLKP